MSVAPLQPVTPPSWKTVLPLSPTSNALLYEVHAGYEISDTIMGLCTQLFSENYGIWGLINFYNKVNTSVSTLVRVNNVSSLKH